MNALEQHLSGRDDRRTVRVAKWLRAADSVSTPLGKWLERKLWIGPLRHMRNVGSQITFRQETDGGWSVLKGGATIAAGAPLPELVDCRDRPVSIVATGPSAREYPWDSVRNGERMIVAVNGAPTFLHGLEIQPDLLVVTDPYFAASGKAHFDYAPGVPLVTTTRAAAMLAQHSPEQLTGRRFSIIERVNAWYGVPALSLPELYAVNVSGGSPFHFPEDETLQLKVGWSDRPELGFFSGCTVVFAALQVVAGLGSKDVEIIGMDLSAQPRIYDEAGNPQPSMLQDQYDRYILPSFEMMARALAGTQIRVRNISPVCPLPRNLFASP